MEYFMKLFPHCHKTHPPWASRNPKEAHMGEKGGQTKRNYHIPFLQNLFPQTYTMKISHFSLWLYRDYFISVGLPCGNKLISFFFPDLWLIYHCPNAINSKFVEVSLVVAWEEKVGDIKSIITKLQARVLHRKNFPYSMGFKELLQLPPKCSN